MILYFTKLAFRNFKKNWVFSTINVMGLGIALASCILIFEYVSNEWNYDKFHDDYESIFRIKQTIERPDMPKVESATTFSAVASELNATYPSIEAITRIHRPSENVVVEYDDKLFREDGLIGVDSTFFNVFNFKFKLGDPATALSYNNAVVITEKIAKKYFGDANPLGKEILFDGAYGYYTKDGYESRIAHVVRGVLHDLPPNTHLDFDILVSLNLYNNLEQQLSNWGNDLYTYIKFDNPAEASSIAEGLDEIVKKYRPNDDIQLELQPMQDIHLTSNLPNEITANGSKRLVWILTIVGLIILIIACTNYINFSIARAIDRYREVGIRKVYWANSTQLFYQLLMETLMINIFALMAACFLIYIAQPFITDLLVFNLMGKLNTVHFWLFLLLTLVSGTLISGVYPAFYISRFKPKNTRFNNFQKPQPSLRKVLVTVQFACSIIAIGCTIILYSQMRFMQQKHLGIDINKTMVINGPNINIGNDSIYNSRLATFKTEVLKMPNVNQVTAANFIPGKEIRGKATGYVRRLGSSEDQAGSYAFTKVDFDFISNFKFNLIAGRAFDESFTSDLEFGQAIIVNEKASELLGFSSPEQAIGEKIIYRINSQPTIVGVVENFHQYSMDRAYQPIIFEASGAPENYYYLKLADDMNHGSLLNLKSMWAEFFPGNPFSYFYLGQYYNRQYKRDDLFMKAFSLFSLLSIIVAAMGFFGLIYYTASSKIQEIGIRKILGAERLDVSILLSQGFLINLGVAAIISLPLIYYISSNWLLDYAFKIDLVWWMFVLPILFLFLIAGLVVTVQTIRTFSINPSITLKEN